MQEGAWRKRHLFFLFTFVFIVAVAVAMTKIFLQVHQLAVNFREGLHIIIDIIQNFLTTVIFSFHKMDGIIPPCVPLFIGVKTKGRTLDDSININK